MAPKKKPAPYYYVYRWGPRAYRLEFRAANGKVLVISPTMFRSKGEALHAINRLEETMNASLVVRTD